MTYKTLMVNFGIVKYLGSNLQHAKQMALSTGFECVIYADDQPVLSYSPVGGWRGL